MVVAGFPLRSVTSLALVTGQVSSTTQDFPPASRPSVQSVSHWLAPSSECHSLLHLRDVLSCWPLLWSGLLFASLHWELTQYLLVHWKLHHRKEFFMLDPAQIFTILSKDCGVFCNKDLLQVLKSSQEQHQQPIQFWQLLILPWPRLFHAWYLCFFLSSLWVSWGTVSIPVP